ncbi:hypothetical protein Aab01nite_49550 [Paractinoplanes abujensis]|uniref:Serine/threonine-protein kinase n=1 Tax=Paractinoplanes abujensis TaxID=882441 RepID=A0A7W7CVB8_9ACTN|nr:hypothetical protein [Actinoplanes abujensis]MBB4693978.1 serine/threonine-protein kinase [Actinoplanes abujensis]GID21365.1 hypothetical protein Aab01nite_49550 [Actinoplanes abujensis]
MSDDSLRTCATGWSAAQARLAGAQAAAALAAAHEAGVTHLALTPDTIVVVRDSDPPVVRLTGFGTSGEERTAYSAPEVGGETPATSAADVYSLGTVLAELFPHLETELWDCWAVDPAARPTATEIASRLSVPPWEKAAAGPPREKPAVGLPREKPAVGLPREKPIAEQPLVVERAAVPSTVERDAELSAPPPSETRRSAVVKPVIAMAILLSVLVVGGLTAARGKDRSRAEAGSGAQRATSLSSAPGPSVIPSPGPTATTARALRATMAAHLPGGAGTLYLAMRDGKAMAYFCDGKKVEAWYHGTASNGRLNLAGRNGNVMTGDFSATSATGKVTFKSRSTSFKIPVVRKPSGLFRASGRVRNAKVDGTWIVLPDGTRTGVLVTGGVPGPAPDLDVAAATAMIGGSPTSAVEVDVETGAGMD